MSDPDPAAGAGVVDLVEGRDYTVTRRRTPKRSPRPIAKRVARPRKPAGTKLAKMRIATRDPRVMVAVGLATIALDWFLNSQRRRE